MYKKKQGKVVRWGAFTTTSVLAVFCAYRVFLGFPGVGTQVEDRSQFIQWFYNVLAQIPNPLANSPITVTPRLLISIALAVFLLLLLSYFCFKQRRVSDFLIDTDSEMRKVAWPTTSEVVNSSLVVIIVIVTMGVYLFLVDVGLSEIFRLFFF